MRLGLGQAGLSQRSRHLEELWDCKADVDGWAERGVYKSAVVPLDQIRN